MVCMLWALEVSQTPWFYLKYHPYRNYGQPLRLMKMSNMSTGSILHIKSLPWFLMEAPLGAVSFKDVFFYKITIYLALLWMDFHVATHWRATCIQHLSRVWCVLYPILARLLQRKRLIARIQGNTRLRNVRCQQSIAMWSGQATFKIVIAHSVVACSPARIHHVCCVGCVL